MRLLGRFFVIPLLFLIWFAVVAYVPPTPVYAQAVSADKLGPEIDEFAAAGAKAYLVWQFSGDKISPFANDKYSFFKGDPICAVLASRKDTLMVGVNMWDAGAHDQQAIINNFSYLATECGVKIIRVFGYAGGVEGVDKVINAAKATGIQLVIAIGDYSNGGGGMPKAADGSWYSSGYRGEYLTLARGIRDRVAQDPGAVWAIELANEPHCGGNQALIVPYRGWVQAMTKELASSGVQIGIGQMASQSTTRCDSPPDDYKSTNSVSGVDVSSAHYYNDAEKLSALSAAQVASSIGKVFYIGESGFAGSSQLNPVFVYPGIEDMANPTQMRQMASSYMLTCGPKFSMDAQILNARYEDEFNGEIQTYDYDFENGVKPHVMFPGLAGYAYIDYSKSTIPLYRMEGATVPDPLRASRRMDDLEGYFSSSQLKQLFGTSNPNSVNSNYDFGAGTSLKLSTPIQQCEDKLTFLNSIKSLCANEKNRSSLKVNNPLAPGATPTPPPVTTTSNRCALDLDVPGNKGYSYLSLLQAKPSRFKCQSLEKTISTPAEKEWYEAFQGVETTTPKGFKPAYIIVYARKPENNPDRAKLDQFANWLAPGGTLNLPAGEDKKKDRVKIIKVYVPAGFAENNSKVANALPPAHQPFYSQYTSAYIRTLQARLTPEAQKEIEDSITVNEKEIAGMMLDTSMNNPNPSTKKYVDCYECDGASETGDLWTLISRRINVSFFTKKSTERGGSIYDVPLDPACNFSDYVGETASEIKHTINPTGVLDPVKEMTVPAEADVQVDGQKGDPLDVKIFFLLPEEYRRVSVYEYPFFSSFVSLDEQKKDEYQFVVRAGEPRKKNASFRYLQLSGAGFHISSPDTEGPEIGTTLFATTDENGTTLTPGERVKLKANIVGSSDNINPNPLVPGGRLARTVWDIVCNLTRNKFDNRGNYVETGPYTGLQSLFKQGLAACVQDSKTATVANTCSGTTTLPARGTSGNAWNPFYQMFRNAVSGTNVPPEVLWGVFRLEGTPTYQAFYDGKTSVVCKANSAGAVGTMNFLVKACGGVFDTWGNASSMAGISGTSPCDLAGSMKAAAYYLQSLYNNPTQHGCNKNYSTIPDTAPGASQAEKLKWIDAAASYNGSCVPLTSPGSGCSYQGKSLTYGECAMIKFAPGFGGTQN